MNARETDPQRRSWWHRLQENGHTLLLIGLLQHLFIGTVLVDRGSYARLIWPINMLLLGALSGALFAQQQRRGRILKATLNISVCIAPIWLVAVAPSPERMMMLSGLYVVFFVTLFIETLQFMARPGKINADLIVSAINGQLLLLESAIFTMQGLYYVFPNSFTGITDGSYTDRYLDMVYFCTIVLTSVGFGDIAPSHHATRLAVSIFALTSHIYSVVIVGVLIGRYTGSLPPFLTQPSPKPSKSASTQDPGQLL
ncbi:MAG: potassium channel family protein [Myxococcota bacterium]